jgi:hypothetical protein
MKIIRLIELILLLLLKTRTCFKNKYSTFLENLPDKINIDDLIERVGNLRDEDLKNCV